MSVYLKWIFFGQRDFTNFVKKIFLNRSKIQYRIQSECHSYFWSENFLFNQNDFLKLWMQCCVDIDTILYCANALARRYWLIILRLKCLYIINAFKCVRLSYLFYTIARKIYCSVFYEKGLWLENRKNRKI